MLWLDCIHHVDATSVHASARIHPQTMFLRGNLLPVWVSIEYMAQAVAAWAGNQTHSRGQPAKIGYLLGTRRFYAHRQHFCVGDELQLRVQLELQGDNGLGMFACQTLVGQELAAAANLSVYQPEDA